jgi:formiminoglutamase
MHFCAMLRDLAFPIPEKIRSEAASLPAFAWGKSIRFPSGENLGAPAIALMGVCGKENAPSGLDAVRPFLYALADPSKQVPVADLGNIGGGAFGILEACEELLAKGILPLVVAGPGEWAEAQARAYERSRKPLDVVAVDSRMDLSLPVGGTTARPTYLDGLFQPGNEWLFHFANLGCQTYFLDPAVLEWFDRQGYDYFRLGRLRESLEEAEPVVRDADLLLFHLGALRAAEVPGCPGASPSGLTIEEACRIVRYASMSDKLGAAGFYGLPDDPHPTTAMAVAQMIWYFVDGFGRRLQDYPMDKNLFTGFVVDLKGEGLRLHFWKSNRSDRWWAEPVHGIASERSRHSPVSCSYSDYRLACEGELSLRLARAFSRF